MEIIKSKDFYYGVLTTGSLCFFACGGMNSLLLTISLFLIINNNFLINDIQYYCIFNMLYYLMLLIKVDFFNVTYFSFCFTYYAVLYRNKLFYLGNIILLFNFNYYHLVLASISIISCLINIIKNNKINKTIDNNANNINDNTSNNINTNIINDNNINILNKSNIDDDTSNNNITNILNKSIDNNTSNTNEILKNLHVNNNNNTSSINSSTNEMLKNLPVINFFSLSALFIQIQGYLCLETLLIYLVVLIDFFSKNEKYNFKIITVYSIIYTLYIIGYKLIKMFFLYNMIFNEKGLYISLLSYLLIIILNYF